MPGVVGLGVVTGFVGAGVVGFAGFVAGFFDTVTVTESVHDESQPPTSLNVFVA